jgi:hypothetical protein
MTADEQRTIVRLQENAARVASSAQMKFAPAGDMERKID